MLLLNEMASKHLDGKAVLFFEQHFPHGERSSSLQVVYLSTVQKEHDTLEAVTNNNKKGQNET